MRNKEEWNQLISRIRVGQSAAKRGDVRLASYTERLGI